MRTLVRSLSLSLAGIAALSGSAFGQQTAAASQSIDPAATAAEVLALEREIEAAVVRGDVAFVDSVLSSDFRFTHGDGWTTGGEALAVDDKQAFLNRVADQEYLVHDLDSVEAEVHGDVVITYGRYVSLFMPRNRERGGQQLTSIWFERVYAKLDGQWKFLSHRTVHGPTPSPAGVDPTALR